MNKTVVRSFFALLRILIAFDALNGPLLNKIRHIKNTISSEPSSMRKLIRSDLLPSVNHLIQTRGFHTIRQKIIELWSVGEKPWHTKLMCDFDMVARRMDHGRRRKEECGDEILYLFSS